MTTCCFRYHSFVASSESNQIKHFEAVGFDISLQAPGGNVAAAASVGAGRGLSVESCSNAKSGAKVMSPEVIRTTVAVVVDDEALAPQWMLDVVDAAERSKLTAKDATLLFAFLLLFCRSSMIFIDSLMLNPTIAITIIVIATAAAVEEKETVVGRILG